MAIITISRGCFSHGKEIAERVAAKLGYECISKEVLLEASHFFNIPEAQLSRSIQEAPGLLDRFSNTRQHFLDCIQAALLEHVIQDNVVYHGHAGHIFLPRIGHVLKVRVMAKMDDRVALVRSQGNLSREKALQLIAEEDRQREEWYHRIYKKDMSSPCFYDRVLHIGHLTIDDACDLICQTVARESFKTTRRSQRSLQDLALSHHVKMALASVCKAEVSAKNGVVRIDVKSQKLRHASFTRPGMQKRVQSRIRDDLLQDITALVSAIPGVKDMVCHIDTPHYV